MKLFSRRIHLVGVGGAGMSGLARLLHGIGADLTGSDAGASAVTRALVTEGLRVWTGSQPERLHGENGYVVRSAAVPADDVEVAACERRGFTSLLYAEAVARLCEGKKALTIAGTHGKTTTTALTVAALRGAGLDPSFLIGGEVPQLGGNGHGGRTDVFAIEACEFNCSFHHYRPFGAALLNVDHDHFDCFPTHHDLERAFAGYVNRVAPGGALLVHEDVPDAVLAARREDVTVLRVGSGLFADLRPADVRERLGRFSFTPIACGDRLPRVALSLSGRFQMTNALFALGLARLLGASLEGACAGISEFGGVSRRFEVHEGKRGGILINDYAHHPAEIRAVLGAARRRFPGRRLLVAFQPHQHQRTLNLLPQFAESLREADLCLVAQIYGARESEETRSRVSARDLVDAINQCRGNAEDGGTIHDLPNRLRSLSHRDDLILVLGAGDIDRVVDDVLAEM
jgi:UDP-N-acetylmuramate--alanine ligase